MGFKGALDPRTESIASAIVDSAYAIHRKFGPGLLESVYEECMVLELSKRGYDVSRQVKVPIVYDGVELATPLRLDLLVADSVIVEVKAIEQLASIHKAQCLTYLKLTGKRLCIIINFNVEFIRDGIVRVIN